MTTANKSNAPKSVLNIPFDVLEQIFMHYSSNETIHHPLETLLLVSRSWNAAATNYPTLWANNLKIHVGHEPTTRIWKARLPRRLARCGPLAPLSIDVQNHLDVPPVESISTYERLSRDDEDDDSDGGDACECVHPAREFIAQALETLAGPKGALCVRWKSVKLDLGHYPWICVGDERIAQTLSYSMPSLENLVLQNVHLSDECTNVQVFPNTPALTAVSLFHCDIPVHINLDTIMRASLVWGPFGEVAHRFKAVGQPSQMQYLHLNLPSTLQLPLQNTLNNLRCLCVDAGSIPDALYTCKMPNLTRLELKLNEGDLLSQMLRLNNVHFGTLRSISLTWDQLCPAYVWPRPEHDLSKSLLEFLRRCSHLERVEIEGKRILGIFVNLLWQLSNEARKPLIRGRSLLNLDRNLMVRFNGNEDIEFIEQLAKDWNLELLNDSLSKTEVPSTL
ncbi:hypothetical protein M408DRAFT_304098 [Serendipita vermifera MAFF 305830]|uniref:F-box domain-containing protein n=1 Tax=Serendipita vermifera MAFF 305830 TaxID=933852 RepID=A0A0C3BD72_SERVB|nr:hypothetical protein M408DRAFT_304098 [Serendipita vermifera MAFF 305830]